MLALARLQRKFRLVESPYSTPQTLVGGPRLDAALMGSSGRTATTKAMGKGSTQFQHLVQTEVPPRLLEEWLAEGEVKELIIATNPTVEGDATAHYLADVALRHQVSASRIAHGVPLGGELEYVDGGTLSHAFYGRRAVD